ncbi:MAG: hypothetical protein ACEQSK_10490 [Sphingomonadaceae bacterium]
MEATLNPESGYDCKHKRRQNDDSSGSRARFFRNLRKKLTRYATFAYSSSAVQITLPEISYGLSF